MPDKVPKNPIVQTTVIETLLTPSARLPSWCRAPIRSILSGLEQPRSDKIVLVFDTGRYRKNGAAGVFKILTECIGLGHGIQKRDEVGARVTDENDFIASGLF